MVGFTLFSERSGEEAAYTLMRSISKLMADAVRGQGGAAQCYASNWALPEVVPQTLSQSITLRPPVPALASFRSRVC